MTITRPIRLLLARGLAAALALGGVVGCVAYPSPPSQPAFDTDVQPIFLAHCTRCHGDGPDGGAFNAASVPGVTYNAAGPPVPIGPFLTQFGSALLWVKQIKQYIAPGYMLRMPPPPAPVLNDWEMKVVNAWTAHPICSNAADPDPTICPGP